MTTAEAVKDLRYQKKMNCMGVNYQPKIEAIDMAISALEKQMSKKPLGVKLADGRLGDNGIKSGICPVCGEQVDGNVFGEFCGCCGQALDWSDAYGTD